MTTLTIQVLKIKDDIKVDFFDRRADNGFCFEQH